MRCAHFRKSTCRKIRKNREESEDKKVQEGTQMCGFTVNWLDFNESFNLCGTEAKSQFGVELLLICSG